MTPSLSKRLTFLVDASSSVRHSSGSPGENSGLGEPQSEECTLTPAVRFGVVLAASLAGGGKEILTDIDRFNGSMTEATIRVN